MTKSAIKTTAHYKSLAEIKAFVEAWANKAKIDTPQTERLQMAVDEGCSFLISTIGGENKGQLQLICRARTSDYHISIKAKPEKTSPPAQVAPETGLFLLKQLMDEVHFIPSQTEPSLTLRQTHPQG